MLTVHAAMKSITNSDESNIAQMMLICQERKNEMSTIEACLATAILTLLFIHGCDRARMTLQMERLEKQVNQLCDHCGYDAPEDCP